MEVEVRLKDDYYMPGPNSPEWDMIIDFGNLDKIVNEVLKNFDHTNLNLFIPNPTAEMIITSICFRLRSKLPVNLELTSLTLWETERSYARLTF